MDGDWPYLWLDATYLKQREGGRIVSVAAIIAVAANTEGKRVMAEPVFSTVRIDDHLPAGHLLRAVDALLDTAFVRRIMAPHYSLIGRPSIDPELMIRMLLGAMRQSG